MKLALVLVLLAVASCGVVYTAPKVEKNLQDGTVVDVVPMTAATIAQANRSKYTPKSLPSAFFATAVGDVNSSTRKAGRMPPPNMRLRLPPKPDVGPYRIGVSDVLILSTTGTGSTIDELTGLLAAQNRRQDYTVQDDGAISIPEVGRLQVSGLTLEEVEAAVFQRLVENQIDPEFSIEISDFNSQRVSIGGAVEEPGVAPISLKPLFLDEALSNAGGVTSKDNKYSVVRIYRNGKRYQVPVNRLYDSDGLQRIQLVDGDSVFVDTTFDLEQTIDEIDLRRAALDEARDNFETREKLGETNREFVYITGEVKTQSRFKLPYGRKATLADALYEDGGIPTETGDTGQIYVLRANQDLTSITAFQLDGGNAVNLILAARMEMRPNDIIFVSEQRVTKWSRVANQILPTFNAANTIEQN